MMLIRWQRSPRMTRAEPVHVLSFVGYRRPPPTICPRFCDPGSDVAEKLEQLRPERIVELEGFARLHCALHQVLAIRSRPESPGDGRDASCAVRVDAQAATSKCRWIVASRDRISHEETHGFHPLAVFT